MHERNPDDRIDFLERRVAYLEKHLNRVNWVSAAALGGFIALFLTRL